MLSQSTGTDMISYSTFHEEIEKIAEEAKPGTITKEKLKRLAIAAPVAAAGAGLGHATGKLVGRAVLTDKARQALQQAARQRPWAAKAVGALPAVAGGLAAGAGVLQAMKGRKMREYIEGKKDDQGPRSK